MQETTHPSLQLKFVWWFALHLILDLFLEVIDELLQAKTYNINHPRLAHFHHGISIYGVLSNLTLTVIERCS